VALLRLPAPLSRRPVLLRLPLQASLSLRPRLQQPPRSRRQRLLPLRQHPRPALQHLWLWHPLLLLLCRVCLSEARRR
jgi:hypothetical protein